MARRQYNRKIWRAIRQTLGLTLAVGLAACSGGGGGGLATGTTISGGGVKGPMANATVTVYAFDAGQPGFKGAAVGSGTTDSSAAISGLSLPFPLNPPYILEFTVNAGTTDITTGQAPVITSLRTVITQAMLDKGEQIYATPLTTMAVDLAVANADKNTPVTTGSATTWPGNNDGTTTAAEFEAALPLAASQVASTVGFGIDSDVDIFDTPPLLDSTTDSLEDQANVAAYRTAVEAVSAVVYEMSLQAAGDTDTVLAELAGDLADGAIDGTVGGQPSDVFTSTTLDVLDKDPATLPIPNSDDGSGNPITVGEVESKVLATETATTGATTDTTALTDGTIDTAPAPASPNPDRDGDGVPNADDAFPDEPAATTDTDGDGKPDDLASGYTGSLVADDDDDGDGVLDVNDDFPLEPAATTDTDGDGDPDDLASGYSGSLVADTDDDNDGVPDVDDAFPLDPAASSFNDADGDGWPVGQDTNDGDATVPSTPFVDTDGDGLADAGGQNPDTDDDNDGVPDGSDDFPLDASEQLDTDGDTIGNNADTDDDGDGVPDVVDAFPLDASESRDRDGDGIGDNSDLDADGDGVSNALEGSGNTPADDTDGDGTPDWLDLDSDNDGIPDATDANRTVVDVPNTAPIATGTSITTGEDTPASGSVTATDAEGDAITFSLVAQAGNGTAAVNGDGTFTYTPSADYSGNDSFTVIASDGSASSNVVTVSVTITPVNDAPVAAAGILTVAEDSGANAGTVSGTDVDGDSLTYTLATAPANGTATLNSDGSYTYTPNANFNGSDSFTFTANDGTADSAPATVTITVTPVNDAPVASDSALTVAEDSTANTGTVSGTDVDGDSLTYALATAPANGTATVNSDGSYTYTPNADFNGSDSFTFTASDGVLGSNAGTVTIAVTPVNDAPVAAVGTLTVAEDSTANPGTVSGSDIDGDALTYALASVPANGTVTVNADGTFSYTPNANFNGSDSFTFVANDGTVDSAPATVTITVTPINDAPVASAGTLTVAEDSTANAGTVSGTDTDGDTLTYALATAPANGTATVNSDGSYTYTPNANFNGSDSFTFTANDGTADSAPATVTITVTPVNDAPVANADTASVVPNGSVTIDVLANDTDIDGDSLSVVAGDAVSTNGVTVINNGNGTFTYTDTNGTTGTDSYSYTLTDGTVSVIGTVTVNIVANNPPVITQGASTTVIMVEDGSPTAFSLTLDATDAESDPLTWSVTTPAANGSASATGSGTGVSVAYTPNADFNGSDSFVVGVSDGTSTTSITVNVTINPVNDAPVISGTAPAATLNTAYSFVPTASDVDGDTLSFTLTGTLPAGLGFNTATGEISGTPTATGTASLTITVSDGTTTAALGPFDLVVNGGGGAVWDNFNWDDGSTWQ